MAAEYEEPGRVPIIKVGTATLSGGSWSLERWEMGPMPDGSDVRACWSLGELAGIARMFHGAEKK